ncbi:hypothetical protein RD792_013029 [Penstemon davidsonii]|uniref:Uncharacterized protein n=1 Tax=Penstemon davidsonii TaxID=160366 RepID=A0ABR0CSW5_9LAMI|nr:hypothetical protein RD792_013029 [Penstemon davidsonii]
MANLVKYLHAKEGEDVDMSDFIFKLVLNIMGNILISMDLLEFGPHEKRSPRAQLKRTIINGSPNLGRWLPIGLLTNGWPLERASIEQMATQPIAIKQMAT